MECARGSGGSSANFVNERFLCVKPAFDSQIFNCHSTLVVPPVLSATRQERALESGAMTARLLAPVG